MFDYLKKGSFDNNKKGQVTIFIILAVLVVAGIVLVIMLTGDSDDSQDVSGDQGVQSPSAFLESCMEDDVRRAVRELRLHGGELNPESAKSFKFENEPYRNISYLCYTESSDTYCSNQISSLVSTMESEVRGVISESSEGCVESLKNAYSEQGYQVSGGEFSSGEDLEADIFVGSLTVSMNVSEISLERTNESMTIEQNSYNFDYSTDLYEFAEIATSMVSREANGGGIDVFEYQNDFPGYDLEVLVRDGEDLRIYSIINEDTSREFRFAVKGPRYLE